MSTHRLGKYACLEIERRYLLRELPADLNEQAWRWQITDRYLPNTRLRLRCMRSPASEAPIFKFGQKYRDFSQDPSQATMTNIYLNETEYRSLEKLEAQVIVKKHYPYFFQGHKYGIEVFEGALAGLILAEIEVETMEALAQLPFPAFALKEVTDDHFFSGGHLATLTAKAFQEGFAARLSEFKLDPNL